jgi:hypothetical protein
MEARRGEERREEEGYKRKNPTKKKRNEKSLSLLYPLFSLLSSTTLDPLPLLLGTLS